MHLPCSPFLLLLLLTFLPLISCQRLFISEYIHNGANSTIIEIYNPMCKSMLMNGEFSIRIAPYAGSRGTFSITIPLTGTIGARSTYVVCHPLAASFGGCSQASQLLDVSGRDAIALFHNQVPIDIVGTVTYMKYWDVAGTVNATKDHGLRRVPRVSEGTLEWYYPSGANVANIYSSTWIVSNPSDLSNIGIHTSDSTCSSALHRLTCGTMGQSNLFLTNVSVSEWQIECPVDGCLSAYSLYNLAVIGTYNYSIRSFVCSSAIHSGAIALNGGIGHTPNLTTITLTPTLSATYCSNAQVQPMPISGIGTQRERGRPYVKMTLYKQTQLGGFYGSTTPCVISTSLSTSFPYFTVTPLNITRCPNDCSGLNVHGICNEQTATCTCTEPWTGEDCSQRSCPGPCYNGGTCNGLTGICSCPNNAFYGDQCQYRACTAYNDCSGHGTCDPQLGQCQCMYPYSGASCTELSCPSNCNSNGICDTSTGTCTCINGYIGDDCSLKSCVDDCSGRGTCNLATGQCVCDNQAMQTGACRTGTCPNDCSAHGSCNYSSQVCICDSGWVGYDCSIKAY